MWGVTGSACATLVAYIVYFVPLLTMLWVRLRVTLFSRKQLGVLLLTVALFALNALWEWLVSPLFLRLGTGIAVVIVQALVRTSVFAVVAIVAVRKLNISPEVNSIIERIPGIRRKRGN